MKKLIVLMATFMLTASIFSIGAATAGAATADTWRFGPDADGKILQTTNTQGENGWYYLYLNDRNKGTSLDTSKAKECVYNDGSAWTGWSLMTSYGTATWEPDPSKDSSIANAALAAAYKTRVNDTLQNWWVESSDGTVKPSGDVTALIGWKAPKTGVYDVKVTFKGGSANAPISDKADGVTFGIFNGKTNVYSKNTGKTSDVLTNSEETKQIVGKDGMLYFTADPNNTFDNDSSNMVVEITFAGTTADASKGEYQFGSGNGSVTPQMTNTQGENGWYYMYLNDRNKGASLDTSIAKNCVYNDGSAWTGWSLMTAYGSATWEPDPAKDSSVANAALAAAYKTRVNDTLQNWWMETADGTVKPSGDVTGVIGWKAPKAGVYKVEVSFKGGSVPADGAISDKADGVTFGVFNGKTSVYSKNTGKTADAVTDAPSVADQTVMKDGMLYFTVDPNNTFDNDSGSMLVKVTLVKEIADTTTTPAATTVTATNIATATKANTNPNPGTGSTIPMLAIGLIVFSGVTVYASKKRPQ